MKQYYFKDVLFMEKEKALAVENDEKVPVGYIKMTDMPACEKGHAFSFISSDETIIKMGIKKRGIRNLLVATYLISTNQKDYTLRDKVGNNLLYFSVEGEIDEQGIKIEENWGGDVEVKVDGIKIATIKTNDFTLKTTIQINEDIKEHSVLFAITI